MERDWLLRQYPILGASTGLGSRVNALPRDYAGIDSKQMKNRLSWFFRPTCLPCVASHKEENGVLGILCVPNCPRFSRMEEIGDLEIPMRSLWPMLHCRRVAGVRPLLSIGWWYLSLVFPKRHCYRVSAADKVCRVYPLDPRPDAVALYSGCTPEPDLLTTPDTEILDEFSDQGVIQFPHHRLPLRQTSCPPHLFNIKPTTQIESRLLEPISASAAAPDNSLNTPTSSLSSEHMPISYNF
ncbi:uncharacterized protein TNCV_4334481 [Trichonephila clavipes]|nr:uncharacterized protein TNCV_4334481 [Trichonephila clavipes]